MGLIKPILSTCSSDFISLLYNGLVCPKIKVEIALASPYLKKDIILLEDVYSLDM